MDQKISIPDASELLPPLLACLLGSESSAKPPPSLLPLLAPTLRVRVDMLARPSESSSSKPTSWLPLLAWNNDIGQRLLRTITHVNIEPHPVSGEIETPEVDSLDYQRRDEETLLARVALPDIQLCPEYTWVSGAENKGPSCWLLHELKPLDAPLNELCPGNWSTTVERANTNWAGEVKKFPTGGNFNGLTVTSSRDNQPEDDEDDDYWGQYCRTPGRTPKGPSPAPPAMTTTRDRSRSELEYFNRYATEVQPALDSHDPDEEQPVESTLTNGIGNPLTNGPDDQHEPPHIPPNGNSTLDTEDLSHPRPTSSTGSSPTSLHRLERAAEQQSASEIGVKQHISTSLKSMYRLATAAGIDRKEFERMITTELECLSMMDMDE